MIEKPTTRSPVPPKDLLKAIGLRGFIKLTFRATYDTLTSSDLRKASKSAVPVRKLMHRDKKTRKYFGYLLIVGRKPE